MQQVQWAQLCETAQGTGRSVTWTHFERIHKMGPYRAENRSQTLADSAAAEPNNEVLKPSSTLFHGHTPPTILLFSILQLTQTATVVSMCGCVNEATSYLEDQEV